MQLAEPVRFRAGWEQAASLRLRAGDASVLAEYDQHGRISGGEPEQMLDAAAAAYVALTVDGTDTLLMAADHALRRELSRRIRDDLIRLGIVQPGPAVRIADGATASPGDLIVCTRNDHAVEAGEPGRTLANGDLLRIDAVTDDGLLVRRALDADPETGQRRWTDRHFLYASYETAELGYAVTDHAAQGRTVHTGLAVITGTEDRQHAYVALTRGTDTNTAYVFTLSPKLADPAPGPRPAPELARYDQHATAPAAGPDPAAEPAGTRDALAVLADVLERDGQQLSATQTWQQALADADHLAVLHAIWTAETSPAREQRYRDLLLAALPPGYRQEPGHQAKWLWRTMRAAELAGLDLSQVLAAAIGERDLTGARDVTAVIDARLRRRTGALIPRPAGPWSAQLPDIADPERRGYTAQIAAAMDARKDRIGEHAADNALPWAVSALGPVPDHPVDRLEWQQRAASIGAYRELSGYAHPADPIGPEPAAAPRTCGPPGTRPWRRSAPSTGPTSAACPTGRCCTCATPTPSKPAGHRSGPARNCARSGSAPPKPAWPPSAPPPKPTPPTATASTKQPPSSRPWRPATRPCTTPTRTRGRLRRRHGRPAAVGDRPPASSGSWPSPPTPNCAAGTPASSSRRCAPPNPSPPRKQQRDELTLTAGEEIPQLGQWIADLAAQHRAFAGKLAERQSLLIPAEDPDYEDLGPAFPAWTGPDRDAILQPPKPQIQPSPRILERAADRDLDLEAAE